MRRGVQAGTQRGHYRRHGKPRLKALARDIRRNRIDREAVAQAFEAYGGAFNRAIAAQLRAGQLFNADRLASAVEKLAVRPQLHPRRKPLPLSMAKAALRHLDPAYGGKGLPVHKALRIENFDESSDAIAYYEHPSVRAYYRQLVKDYGPRGPRVAESHLDQVWANRQRGRFPHVEEAIKAARLGHGVPLELWRAARRKY